VAEDPGPTPGDEAAFRIADDLEAGWLTDVNEVVTELGSTPVTLAVALLAGIALAAGRRWPEVIVLLVALAIVHLAVPVLKEIVERPRPPDPIGSASGFSWPSGHATYAILYPWLALTVAMRIRPKRTVGTVLVVAGILIAAAVGLSRVYLRVHYLSDVTSGAALGVSAFAACAAVALLVLHLRDNLRRT